MPKGDVTVSTVLQTIEKAVGIISSREAKLGLSLDRVQIVLKVASKENTGAKVDLRPWLPVRIGGDYKLKSIQTMTFTLGPRGKITLGDGEDINSVHDLVENIDALAAEIKAVPPSPLFRFTDAILSMEFGITADGGLKVAGLGRVEEGAETHSMKLTFRRPEE